MMHRRLSVVVLCLVAAACGGPGSSTSSPSASGSASAELVADVDVGGRTLHLVCVGSSADSEPTVLLEAGGGLASDQWAAITAPLAATHRVCAYDRAGLGASDPPTVDRRTATDLVADLRALLEVADIDGPFVIAAHSVGAFAATLFTATHPDDVVGLVFVDPQGPRADDGWLEVLAAQVDANADVVRLREDIETFDNDPSLNPERLHVAESAREVNGVLDAAGPLFGDRPVVVLQAADTPRGWANLPQDLQARLTDIWWAAQRQLADESSAGTVEVVPDVGHDIPVEAPGAVVDALERVLAAAGG